MFLKIRISHREYFGLAANMDWFVGELLGGTRVAQLKEGSSPVLSIDVDDQDDIEQQLRSNLDDIFVVDTRNQSMKKAIIETRNGEAVYGEFDKKEPVMGPAESQILQSDFRDPE